MQRVVGKLSRRGVRVQENRVGEATATAEPILEADAVLDLEAARERRSGSP